MLANIKHQGKTFTVNLHQPIDISLPLRSGKDNVNAWYVDEVKIDPVISEYFIGDVNMGGAVNFRNITFNPHGNGTHTECVGHISKEKYYINNELKNFFFIARLVSISPEIKSDGDKVITLNQIKEYSLLCSQTGLSAEAFIIRTLPNNEEKKIRQYSNTNPPYVEKEAMPYLTKNGIHHLLIDLPSIDREFDEGKLSAHHSFWQYPENSQIHRTITELIFIPDYVEDGFYFMNLQIASFENDATPSKPVLFRLESEYK